MEKENVVHIHNGILLSIKKKKPFAATWMELEIITQSEVMSGRERQILLMWNLKYAINELI